MSSDHLVTIAVTAFERVDLLRTCLESLIAQSHTAVEIRVHDNSASEDVRRLVAELADPRVSYERNPPNASEIVINHQKAFVPGRGKYHMVLSSDWALRRDAIQLLVDRLERDPRICLATGDWAQRVHANGQEYPRDLLFAKLELDAGNAPIIDSRRFIEQAFRDLRGVGIAYHSLIASDALRYGNVEKVYLNQGFEHQAGLELALLKPGFGVVREPLFIELVNNGRYNSGEYRSNTRLSEAVARARFFEKNYLELLSRGFNVSQLRWRLCLMFLKCAFRPDERPIEACFFAARYAVPMTAALLGMLIVMPARGARRLIRDAVKRARSTALVDGSRLMPGIERPSLGSADQESRSRDRSPLDAKTSAQD